MISTAYPRPPPARQAERRALRNGQQVTLSPISAADRQDLRAGFEQLSARTRYLRFFSTMPQLPDVVLEGLTGTDGTRVVAVGARLLDATGAVLAPIIGVARYHRPDEQPVAEAAVAVADHLHGQGLGQLLMRRIAALARLQGITRFRAHALWDNVRVRHMLHAAGSKLVEEDGPVLIYELALEPAATAPPAPAPGQARPSALGLLGRRPRFRRRP